MSRPSPPMSRAPSFSHPQRQQPQPPQLALQTLADSVRRISAVLPSSSLADVRLADVRAGMQSLVPLVSMPVWLPFSFMLSAFSYFVACVLQALDGSESGATPFQARDAFKLPRLAGGMSRSPSSTSLAGGSSMLRALDQVLELMTALPLASPKYNFTRELAEQLLADNAAQKPPLVDLNRIGLSKAFRRTMEQLEAVLLRAGGGQGAFNQILRRCSQATGWATGTLASGGSPDSFSAQASAGRAEKLSQELLWLVERLFQFGGGAEALGLWASAPTLADAARGATPRVQGSLVKLSALLVRASAGSSSAEWHAGGILRRDSVDRLVPSPTPSYCSDYRSSPQGTPSSFSSADTCWDSMPSSAGSDMAGVPLELQSRLLLLWLPLMCRANHGGDGPILSSVEKQRTEEALQRTILKLSHAEQELLFSSWLHEFSWSSSDWPNLQPQYVAWCERARHLAASSSKLDALE